MEPNRTYYTPTPTNAVMVAKLRELDRFKGKVEFLPLPGNSQDRRRALLAIKGRAAFMWDDGRSHGESYFFTRHPDVKFKANIDAHSDRRDGDAIPKARDNKWKRWDITMASHMSGSARDGIEIMTPDMNRIDSEYLQDARRRVFAFGDRGMASALTVDCDGIRLFPGFHSWVFETGLRPDQVAAFVERVSANLFRFDIGGMVFGVRGFKVIGKRDIILPEIGVIKGFSSAFENPNQTEPFPEDLQNHLCSYAFWTYADALGAFFGV